MLFKECKSEFSNELFTLIVAGHGWIYDHGSEPASLNSPDSEKWVKKKNLNMSTTLQVNDTDMTTKQRSRIILGWFEGLEHLSNKESKVICHYSRHQDAKDIVHYTLHCNVWSQNKWPYKNCSLFNVFIVVSVLRSHTIWSWCNNNTGERPEHCNIKNMNKRHGHFTNQKFRDGIQKCFIFWALYTRVCEITCEIIDISKQWFTLEPVRWRIRFGFTLDLL